MRLFNRKPVAQSTPGPLDLQIAQEQLREATAKAYAAEAEQLRAMNATRPSRNYPVTLTFDGLEWVCRFSSGLDPRNDLIGRGEHPELAMLSFDQQWYGVSK
jgi:hypothetical protein